MAFTYLTPLRRSRSGGAGGSMFDLHRQMNRLFEDILDQDGDSGFYGRSGMAAPAMDIHQTEKEVEITAELPGVKEEDIDISIDDSVLTLRGEKKSRREDKEGGYRERSYGSFERRITLPPNIDEDSCSADFKNGILTITLPKSEVKSGGRKIAVGSGRSGKNDAEKQLIEQNDKSGQKRENEKG